MEGREVDIEWRMLGVKNVDVSRFHVFFTCSAFLVVVLLRWKEESVPIFVCLLISEIKM